MVPPVLSSAKSLTIFTIFTLTSILVSLAKHDPLSAGPLVTGLLATSKTKKQNKPSSLLNKSVMKKEFRRMAKAVSNQVADNYYRPDLKRASLARLSAVNRSLKVAKSGVKKRNRQA
ncbi:large ribosomal subunit protein eL28z-like [Nicotiana sylvestris]|uniref:large ribosomal subunit protein eL28z-like n=1 Tax=Nicotiana sylvestris TaxID=4096 RepID=UPI00388CA4D7